MAESCYFRGKDLYVPGPVRHKGKVWHQVLDANFLSFNSQGFTEHPAELLSGLRRQDLFEIHPDRVRPITDGSEALVRAALWEHSGEFKVRRLTDAFHVWLNTILRGDRDLSLRLSQRPVGVAFLGEPDQSKAELLIPSGVDQVDQKPLVLVNSGWVKSLKS